MNIIIIKQKLAIKIISFNFSYFINICFASLILNFIKPNPMLWKELK